MREQRLTRELQHQCILCSPLTPLTFYFTGLRVGGSVLVLLDTQINILTGFGYAGILVSLNSFSNSNLCFPLSPLVHNLPPIYNFQNLGSSIPSPPCFPYFPPPNSPFSPSALLIFHILPSHLLILLLQENSESISSIPDSEEGGEGEQAGEGGGGRLAPYTGEGSRLAPYPGEGAGGRLAPLPTPLPSPPTGHTPLLPSVHRNAGAVQ